MTTNSVKVKVGEFLYFKWGDVLKHDLNLLKGKAAYDSCNTQSGVSKVILEDAVSTTYKYGPFLKKGTTYFACGVPGHCKAPSNQKVAVTAA